jgi:hypothetical protein
MSQHDVQFFINLMIVSFKKLVKNSLFILCKISNQKKTHNDNVYMNVFNHIVTFQKNYMKFLCTIGSIIFFVEVVSSSALWV